MTQDLSKKIENHRFEMILKALAQDGIAGKMLQDAGEGPKVLRKAVKEMVAFEKDSCQLFPDDAAVTKAKQVWNDYLALRDKNVVGAAA